MNLYLIGLNTISDIQSRLPTALRGMTAAYPQLDPETLSVLGGERWVLAAMHTAVQAAGPRRYLHVSSDEIAFYDGCPLAVRGEYNACDAQHLAAH